MGAGIHGGFGKTKGNRTRLRIGRPVPPTEKDLHMALDPQYYANIIAKKYNIHLKGAKTKISIIFRPDLYSAGRVREKAPNIIELGPLAFISEGELANTIAHELNHARSFLKGGRAPEKTAYASGDKFEEYIKGRR